MAYRTNMGLDVRARSIAAAVFVPESEKRRVHRRVFQSAVRDLPLNACKLCDEGVHLVGTIGVRVVARAFNPCEW